tara:strand:+ start:49 stop:456 length:408 start_codon:yes stop_codon:yes gene_type:complete
MKSLSRISTIFIVFTFVFASENNSTIAGENTDVNDTDSNIQAIDLEVLPIDVEKINESRIQKSIREKKYAQSILKKQQGAKKEQQELLESQIKKDKEKSVFKRWSSDARSKFSVITLKRENGNKAIKLPSTPESK